MTTPETPGNMRRRLRSLLKALDACVRESRLLTAAGEQEREAERTAAATRRKTLTGVAVIDRVQQRPRLIAWLRRMLDAGLTRAYDRKLFCLTGAGPLIPREDWIGWPDAPVDATLPEASSTALSPARRRARLAYLTKQEAKIRAELDDVQTLYQPHRDERNRQRTILIGAVLLTLACRRHGVARWLRLVLDRRYTEQRDRVLFVLEDVGPLVPEEDQAALRPTAKTLESDSPTATNGKTRRSPSAVARTRSGAGRGRRAPVGGPASTVARTRGGAGTGSSDPSNTARAPKGEPGGHGSVHPDVSSPIPGWKPCRLERSASVPGGRTRRSMWGAKLTGRAAVMALPEEMVGTEIIVTDSNMLSWTTTVTGIVSRDPGNVIVRNAGRPVADGTGSPRRPAPESSSN